MIRQTSPVSHERDAARAQAPSATPADPRALPRWLWPATLVVALLIRAAYLLDYRDSPFFDVAVGPDVTEYHEWAEEILGGQRLWTNVPFHGPGYAYWLAMLYGVTGRSIPWVRLLQLALGMASLGLVTHAVRRRLGAGPALATAALWAVNLPLIYYEAELFAEGLVLFLLSAVLALLLTIPIHPAAPGRTVWRHAAIGLCLGLAVITHSTALLAAVSIVLWLAIQGIRDVVGRHRSEPGAPATGRRRKERVPSEAPHTGARRSARFLWANAMVPPLIVAAAAALPIIPVSWHNTGLNKGFVLVQKHDGLNFYIGNNAEADGTPNVRFGPDWTRLRVLPIVQAGAKTEAEYNVFHYRRAWDFIRAHTGEWFTLLGRKAALCFSATEITASTPLAAVQPEIAMLRGPLVSFGVLTPLAFLGAIGAGWRRAMPALILVAAFTLSQTVFVTAGRYRVPMLPGLMLLAGLGWSHLIVRWRNRDVRALGWSALPLLGGALLAFVPPVPSGNEDPAEAAFSRAHAYMAKSRWQDAAEQLERAVHLRPHYAPARITFAMMLEKLNQPDQALTYYHAAVDSCPEYPWGHRALAAALAARGERDLAVTHYRQAVALDPTDVAARKGWAQELENLGNLPDAVVHYVAYLERRPKDADTRLHLVELLQRLERYEDAVAQLKTGLTWTPQRVEMFESLARLLVACPRDEVRAPEVGLRLARQAASMIDLATIAARAERRLPVDDPRALPVLDTLAIAYAANGEFELAGKTATLALQMASPSDQPRMAERLEMFRRREAYLDPEAP